MNEHLHDTELQTMPPSARAGNDLASAMKTIDRVARADCNVLIMAERGSGLDAVARTFHDRSSRKTGPFVVLDCGAVPTHDLEEALFGRSGDAESSAVASADRGTLFVVEVGDLPDSAQSRLLRLARYG